MGKSEMEKSHGILATKRNGCHVVAERLHRTFCRRVPSIVFNSLNFQRLMNVADCFIFQAQALAFSDLVSTSRLKILD